MLLLFCALKSVESHTKQIPNFPTFLAFSIPWMGALYGLMLRRYGGSTEEVFYFLERAKLVVPVRQGLWTKTWKSTCSASHLTGVGYLPEFCTKVSEGEVEGVGGAGRRPSGRLEPHHAAAIALRLQGEVAAHLLHALAQLLEDERVWGHKASEELHSLHSS